MSPESSPASSKIFLTFKDAESRVVFSPGGVWGGKTPDGRIMAHFYVEGRSYPDSIEMEIDPAGKVTDKTQNYPPGGTRYTREILASMLVDPQRAVSIGQWLVARGTEELKKQPKPQSPPQ